MTTQTYTEIRPSYTYDNVFIGMVTYLINGSHECVVGASCPIRFEQPTLESCDWF
jgi:hypothetical protein